MNDNKRIIIIAGPNGAGKTTFADEFLPNEADCLHFVNADLIAAGIEPYDPAAVARRAARVMLETIDHHISQGNSFVFETTLAGKSYLQRIKQWRAQGYRVTLLFLYLPDVQQAIERVTSRVREGGHDIPDPVIRRRFRKGWDNFNALYKMAVDSWVVYDNSGKQSVPLDWSGKNG